MNKFLKYFFFILLLSSCKFECSIGDTGKSKSSDKSTGEVTITNSINITSNSTKLQSATLIFSNGTKVSEDNVVDLNLYKEIKLQLLFAESNNWKVIDNKCSIGASEKITSDDGTILLDTGDLFEKYTEGIDVDKSQVVRLSAEITKPGSAIKYYIVYFKVWDKNSSAEISGNYKFYVKV